jgi:hypothetical protein
LTKADKWFILVLDFRNREKEMKEENIFHIRDHQGNKFTILADSVFANGGAKILVVDFAIIGGINILVDKIVAVHWDEDGAAWIQSKVYFKDPVLSLYVSDGKLLTAEQIELAKESVMEFVGGII